MVKHYTENIPQELAEKLKGVGMPIDRHQIEDKSPEDGSCSWKYEVTYAEVIDWLMEKGIYITIFHRWSFVYNKVTDYLPIINETTYSFVNDWHETANKAIEFAINKMKKQ